MPRREFLKAGLSLGLLSFMPALRRAWSSQGEERRWEGTVLVLGAGIAGLGAARQLKASGATVTLLEGRERVGGRIWTDRSLGPPVDLGASWLEGIDENPLTGLIKAFGVKTAPVDYESFILYDEKGTRVPEGDVERLYTRTEQLIGKTREINRQIAQDKKGDITVAEALKHAGLGEGLTEAERRIVEWALAWEIESEEAEDLEQLSLKGYWGEGEADPFGGETWAFPRGLGQLTEYLARGLDIRLGCVVKEIAYGTTGVTVTTSRGIHTADKAIVTFPLGVLKHAARMFSPPLPKRKREAIRRLGVGAVHKLVLRYAMPFWPRETSFLGYASSTRGEFVEWTNMLKSSDSPVLVLWSHGAHARELESKPEDEVIGRAIALVRKMFGTRVPDPQGTRVTRWQSDPFSRGAYSNIPLGAFYEDFDELAAPVAGRLYFAGEATHRGHFATVHGAYLSGLREAERIAVS